MQLIAYPTIKLPPNTQAVFKELETVLTQLHVPPAPCRNTTPFHEGPTTMASTSHSMRTTPPSSTNSWPPSRSKSPTNRPASTMTSRQARPQPGKTRATTGRANKRNSIPSNDHPKSSSAALWTPKRSRPRRSEGARTRVSGNIERW